MTGKKTLVVIGALGIELHFIRVCKYPDKQCGPRVACVEFIFNQIGVSFKLAYHQHVSSIVRTNLINRFKNNLNSTLVKYKADTNEGKLRTYALFKTHFQKKKYLSVIKDTEIRKCFMSFRIRSHKLEIERGRYKKLDVKDRLAKYVTLEPLKMSTIYCSIAVLIIHYGILLWRRRGSHAKTFQFYHKMPNLFG